MFVEDLYIAATVDQGGNMVNAFRNMGVPVLIARDIGSAPGSAGGWAPTVATTRVPKRAIRVLARIRRFARSRAQ